MNLEVQQVCAQLTVAAANGLYQGLAVALLVGLGLRLLGRTNAATRHAIWLATLVVIALLIPAHCWLERRPANEARAPQPTRGAMTPVALSTTPFTAATGTLPGPISASAAAGQSQETLLPPASAVSTSLPESVEIVSRQDGPSAAGLPALAPTRNFLAKVLHPLRWDLQSRAGSRLLAAAAFAWLIVALLRLVRLGRHLFQLRNLIAGAERVRPELAVVFERLQKEANPRRRAELRVSTAGLGPAVLGFPGPVILLPKDLAAQAEPTELEHVLRHELAHIRRYDDWANLLQQGLQAVLFFHPAAWWIGRQLSLQREIACDDSVLAHAGGRRSYALTLASVAGRFVQPAPLLAPGVSNQKSHLQQRINMILNTRRNSAPGLAPTRLVSVLSATSLLGALALCAGPRFGLAQVASTAAPGGDVPVTRAIANPPNPVPVQPEATEPTPPGAAVPETRSVQPMAPPQVNTLGSEPEQSLRPAAAATENGQSHASIEARLDRLERMVKELLAQRDPKVPQAFAYPGDAGPANASRAQQMYDDLKASADRQAARAEAMAQKMAEQAKRMQQKLEARLDQETGSRGQVREALQQQLAALRKEREAMGQEIERLKNQIEKLQRQQVQGDEPSRNDSGAKP